MIESVTSRIRPWHLAVALALATAAAITTMEWWSLSRRYDAGHMLARLPVENSVKLGEMEMNHGSPQAHGRLMAESMQALQQPM